MGGPETLTLAGAVAMVSCGLLQLSRGGAEQLCAASLSCWISAAHSQYHGYCFAAVLLYRCQTRVGVGRPVQRRVTRKLKDTGGRCGGGAFG